ncbi:hypothetical protein ABPG73_022962, partial [Tetrahymena malaccensis]
NNFINDQCVGDLGSFLSKLSYLLTFQLRISQNYISGASIMKIKAKVNKMKRLVDKYIYP